MELVVTHVCCILCFLVQVVLFRPFGLNWY